MMEILDCHLYIGEFFNGNPFILFVWESFLVNEVMDCISNTLRVNDVFYFGFFNIRDDFRGRWQ